MEKRGIGLVLRGREPLCFALFDDELGAVAGTLDISGPVEGFGDYLVARDG